MAAILSSLIIVPIVEVIHFFTWWYGAGLAHMARWMAQEWRELEDHIHWKQWAAALFVPMYGQYDWKGRIVSIVMRLVVLAYKTIWVAVWTAFHLLLFATYVVFPLVAIGMSAASFIVGSTTL